MTGSGVAEMVKRDTVNVVGAGSSPVPRANKREETLDWYDRTIRWYDRTIQAYTLALDTGGLLKDE